MSFFKHLLGKKEKASVEPIHGGPILQTQAEQDVTRHRMESEMAEQRAAREQRSKN
jgi:hypothetical protein